MAIGGATRWGGLRAEPYNRNPKDADNDGVVQEGTAFERPAGAKYINAAGEEISDLLTGTNISQLDGLRLVDADGNDVSYTQTWRNENLSIGDRLGTIGDSMGNITTTLGTVDKGPTIEDYRGLHSAPTRDTGAALHDLSAIYPEDVYSPMGMRLYGSGDPADARRDRELFSIISAARGNPDAEVIMYRAVPEEGVDAINSGDWVTPSRSYAQEHGEGPMRGRYRIIEQRVRAGDLFTDGNYIYEFGYDPAPADDKSPKNLSEALALNSSQGWMEDVLPTYGIPFKSSTI
jgi:hypothetical protein